MEIVSGRTGKPHVTSQQFRQFIEGTVGQDSYILRSGEKLEPQLASNNSLKIRSGMMCHHGNISSVKIGTYDEVELTNGTQGMKRIDLVVNRYTRNEEDNTEKNEWVVIMGTPAESNPAVPEYIKGNLQNGDLVDDCPVFEVHFDGINIVEVTKKLEIAQTNKDLVDRLKPVNITDQFSVTVGANCPLSCTLESVIQCGNVIQMNGIFTKNKQGWISGSSDVSMKILHKTEPDKYKPLSYRNPVILGALNDSKNTDLHLNYLNSGYFYGVSRVDSSSTVMQHSWQITYIMAG